MAKKSVIQQIKSVQQRYKQAVEKVNEKQERVLTAIAIVVQGNAQFYTPQDTNALINSQYRQIIKKGSRYTARIGYTQKYAAALHARTDWQPKPPNTKGKRGGGYNPNAQPMFLKLGVDDSKDEIKVIIKELNKI